MYADLTKRVLADGKGEYIANCFVVTFYSIFSLLGFGITAFASMHVDSLSDLWFLILLDIASVWMTTQSLWVVFILPLRVSEIRRSMAGVVCIKRGFPKKEIGFDEAAALKYDLSWGNFRLDLNQRGNAPRGLNIWFDYRGQRFWIPEASANYREALYGLAEHAQLEFDPTLCRWERRWFWGKWRQCRKRPELEAVIAEIHRILAGEQTRPEPEPEPVQAAVPVTPPAPIEPTPESLARNLDAQKPVGEEMAVPTIDGLRVGNATVQLRKGKATLIVPPRKR